MPVVKSISIPEVVEATAVSPEVVEAAVIVMVVMVIEMNVVQL